jgi:type VI secretion system protein ImpM
VNIGLYGKLPSHGDFLRRRVSDAFVNPWDEWLRHCIAASRERLGEQWLELYLTSPVWRFACAPGSLAPHAACGVLIPSVDRVGRYYPLTIVAELSEGETAQPGPLAVAAQCDPWFGVIENLALEALATEQLDFEPFDAAIAASAEVLEPLLGEPDLRLDPADANLLMEDGLAGWHVPLASADNLFPLIEQLAYSRLRKAGQPLSLWWTDGSACVAPCCLFARGMPHPGDFASYIDGDWSKATGGWRFVRANVSPPADHAITIVEDATPPEYVSAGRSERGPVRQLNQDAFLERGEAGLWVVADGMGGHEHGELASRMVCDSLADLTPEPSLEGLSKAVQQRLAEVNAHLFRAATSPVAPMRSGATVVVLLTRGSACQVLWAGDSRAYRFRGGRLELLTRDHSWRESATDVSPAESFVVTRAVGGEEALDLDVYQGRVRRGDRFLLCSDGLIRAVTDSEIARCLDGADADAAASALIDAALKAGAPDNVTAIVVATR